MKCIKVERVAALANNPSVMMKAPSQELEESFAHDHFGLHNENESPFGDFHRDRYPAPPILMETRSLSVGRPLFSGELIS
jgi:hypothetical protein